MEAAGRLLPYLVGTLAGLILGIVLLAFQVAPCESIHRDGRPHVCYVQ